MTAIAAIPSNRAVSLELRPAGSPSLAGAPDRDSLSLERRGTARRSHRAQPTAGQPPSRYLAWRVADVPARPATEGEANRRVGYSFARVPCSECGQIVWAHREHSRGSRIVCWPCDNTIPPPSKGRDEQGPRAPARAARVPGPCGPGTGGRKLELAPERGDPFPASVAIAPASQPLPAGALPPGAPDPAQGAPGTPTGNGTP